MAIHTLVCPQCGASLNIDEKSNKDIVCCDYCQAKIRIREKIEIRHVIDNSEQTKNSITLADRAYEAGNFQEARMYYSKALESTPNDVKALYRKGICCIYDTETSGFKEFESYCMIASEEINILEDENAADRLRYEMDSELKDIFDVSLELYAPYKKKYNGKEECICKEAEWDMLLDLTYYILKVVRTEDIIDEMTLNMIHFIDKTFKPTLVYRTQVRNDEGKLVYVNSNYKIKKSFIGKVDKYRKLYANVYNNLPSRLEKTNLLADKLEIAKKELEEAKKALKLYKKDADFSGGIKGLFKSSQYKENPNYEKFLKEKEILKNEYEEKKTAYKSIQKQVDEHKKSLIKGTD